MQIRDEQRNLDKLYMTDRVKGTEMFTLLKCLLYLNILLKCQLYLKIEIIWGKGISHGVEIAWSIKCPKIASTMGFYR